MPKPRTTRIKMDSLKDTLNAALPTGFNCTVRYVQSTPKRCDPLFSPPPGHDPELTRLASHFLTVSITPSANEEGADVFAFAVEALVYSTKRLTTIFVSKADSTGYLPQQRPSPVKIVISTFLKWLSTKERLQHPSRKLAISLFARSQSQYLFPGSADSGMKHVLDDRQLIKWWARVLDPIFPTTAEKLSSNTPGSDSSEYNAYITIPGISGPEIRPFIPPRTTSTTSTSRWHPGNPLTELAVTRGISKDAPPRCLLPRFPDDPKARFMQDLDDEAGLSEEARVTISPSKRRKKEGKWSSVADLERFWEAMEFRQECSSGRMVGFLWVVIGPPASAQNGSAVKNSDVTEQLSQESTLSTTSSDAITQDDTTRTKVSPKTTTRRRTPLTGPIIPRQPRLKGGSSSLTASDLNKMLPTEESDAVVLSKEGYDAAMHQLLHLDFGTLSAAIQSTKKWVSEVSGLAGQQSDWGMRIVGTAAPICAGVENRNEGGGVQVNDLGSMVKRKRKAEDQSVAEPSVESVSEERPAVNVLSAGLVRKKAKPVPG